ncbi:hypothetical protein INR49_012465 [Caranx melampygus]|nr:hypothetical protein INR49_012465 [Caranx melampygus]
MVQLVGSLRKELADSLSTCKVLVVGAGGIGCELLKNLVLTGFKNIEVIDLDTIDVSNLNRQFLFQKKHVGKSKAQVAKESALQFCPSANIIAYHDSVMNPDYNVEFFRKFMLVMNALDNRAARNHVNRMCLAADIPLIESGTAGYLGQVTVIKKGLTECYECQPKPTQKTFPGCTIRNTPSEPIHCIVWAKYLFNYLEKRMPIKRCHLTQQIQRLHGTLRRQQPVPQPQKRTGISSASPPRNGLAPPVTTLSNCSTR